MVRLRISAISTFTTGIFRTFYGFGDLTAAAQLSFYADAFRRVADIFPRDIQEEKQGIHETSGKKTHQTRIELRGRSVYWGLVGLRVSGLLRFRPACTHPP